MERTYEKKMDTYLEEKSPQRRKDCKYTWQKTALTSCHIYGNFATNGRPYIWPVNNESCQSIGREERRILSWLNMWHCTISKMASVGCTRGKRSVSFFAALNVMCVADFCAESKPGRRMIDSGRFFEVERQSWLAEFRQHFAPTSRLDDHTTWKFS